MAKQAVDTEASCKQTCTNTAECDYYVFASTTLPNWCYCGSYSKMGESFDVDASLSSVTLHYKKGNELGIYLKDGMIKV